MWIGIYETLQQTLKNKIKQKSDSCGNWAKSKDTELSTQRPIFPCMVPHACNIRTQATEAEDQEFKTSLGYTSRLDLKNAMQCTTINTIQHIQYTAK